MEPREFVRVFNAKLVLLSCFPPPGYYLREVFGYRAAKASTEVPDRLASHAYILAGEGENGELLYLCSCGEVFDTKKDGCKHFYLNNYDSSPSKGTGQSQRGSPTPTATGINRDENQRGASACVEANRQRNDVPTTSPAAGGNCEAIRGQGSSTRMMQASDPPSPGSSISQSSPLARSNNPPESAGAGATARPIQVTVSNRGSGLVSEFNAQDPRLRRKVN